MRYSLALLTLFMLGCAPASNPDPGPKLDIAAAREYVRKSYSAPHISFDFDLVEGPEYADIPKIPRDHLANWAPDRSASCGVWVKFTYRDGNRTTHDDWIVWVNSDHKAVGFSGNPKRDKWREFVRSVARKE